MSGTGRTKECAALSKSREDGESFTVKCVPHVTGDRVRISQQKERNRLSLCEVEVYGFYSKIELILL